MSGASKALYLTRDNGLLEHWKRALKDSKAVACHELETLSAILPTGTSLLWVDLALPGLPAWDHPVWAPLLRHPALKVIATSSNPKDTQAMAALDAGCAGYCHAYADAATLRQVEQVVRAGHVWIGAALMQKLIQGANHAVAARPPAPDAGSERWSETLTAREKQVALLAAQGASNQRIAEDCDITERTVKAHLSAVFDKLGVTDRLQLALKVHGIR
ncbi:response regulator transcription factor [uncultured Rhodoferax sp.]|uniref:response regulator transcription factor n=1 Tax=uncultured Rhodoferax sp. TaxID=223188 RepID=UPI0025D1F030|nr:response regulator transcription factor [uncultured Rhodoferax sp.]